MNQPLVDFSINMQKKNLILTAILIFFVVFFQPKAGQPLSDIFSNIVSAQGDYGLSGIAPENLKKGTDLPTISGQALGAILSLVGIVFFLLMIYGGVLWMTARGNSQQTEKALNIIISAAIGLVIVLGSYTLVTFVFKLTGAPQ